MNEMPSAAVRVACDVGGTFTDVCILEEATGRMRVAKTPTTPDPIDGVLNGIAAGGVDLKDVVLFSHGTTLATNALITRNFPPAIMVTTRGFRDVIEIRRGTRDDLWDTYKEMAPPYIKRRDRLVVTERIDYSGAVVEPVNEAEAREAARIINKRGVKTIAVCFANAFANPENERRMCDILEDEVPGASISLSSEIMPEIFEHERFSTTVANAVLAPVAGDYVKRLAARHAGRRLRRGHPAAPLRRRRDDREDGGKIRGPARGLRHRRGRHRQPIRGPARGLRELDQPRHGRHQHGCLALRPGTLRVTTDWYVQYGYPICFPSIEVLTIGAGGGSLAWIDEANSLRNGPQSAGSAPGPACYGRGGAEPTNSDANIVLGRISDRLAGGAVTLDRALAEDAIRRRVADPLGLSLQEAAVSILKVANANMADAVRLVSIRRGYDPRDFALVVFGGAGPLHGVALARDLSIPTVLVPPNPGVTSALGCLLVDIKHDMSQMYLRSTDDARTHEIEETFRALEDEGRQRLLHEGVTEDRMQFQRFVDMRYLGQWRSMSIALDAAASTLDAAIAQFHEEHGREHNYSRPDAPVEIYRLTVTATGLTRKAEFAKEQVDRSVPRPARERLVVFDEEPEPIVTPIYDRDDLHAGAIVEGPAIVEQLDSTVLVPPGLKAEVDPWHTIVMRIPQAES